MHLNEWGTVCDDVLGVRARVVGVGADGVDAHVRARHPVELQGRDGNGENKCANGIGVLCTRRQHVSDAPVDVDIRFLDVALLVLEGDVLVWW